MPGGARPKKLERHLLKLEWAKEESLH